MSTKGGFFVHLQGTIYRLRREQGLSQEQLAQSLGVSRQAVSKWESGRAIPDVGKIVRMSELFCVTTDELLKGMPAMQEPIHTIKTKRGSHAQRTAGWILCLMALAGGTIWAVSLFLVPSAHERLNASSGVALNGSGLLLMGCIVTTLTGGILLWRQRKNR